MKLTHPLFSAPIVFDEASVQVLVVENPKLLRELLLDLAGQAEGKEGRFVLSENDQCLDCAEHLHVVQNVLDMQQPERRVQTRLMAAVLEAARTEMAAETLRLTLALREYLGRLTTLVNHPMAYAEEENLAELLKAMQFKLCLRDLPPHEALWEQLLLHHKLLGSQCFVLLHARTLLSAQEMERLYEMALYEKMPLLLLEARAPEQRLPQEVYRLYDGDMCELGVDK